MYNFDDFKEYNKFMATYESFMNELDEMLNENEYDEYIESLNEDFFVDTAKNFAKEKLDGAAKDNPTLKAMIKTKRTAATTAAGKKYKKFYLASELTPIMARIRKDKVADKDGKDSSAYANAEKAADMAAQKVEAIKKKAEAAKMRMNDEAGGDKDIQKLVTKIEMEAKEEAGDKIYKIASEEQAKAEGWSKERIDKMHHDADEIDKEYAEIEKRNAESDKEKAAEIEQNMSDEQAEEYKEIAALAQKMSKQFDDFKEEFAQCAKDMEGEEYDKDKEGDFKTAKDDATNYYKNMIEYYSKQMNNLRDGKDKDEGLTEPQKPTYTSAEKLFGILKPKKAPKQQQQQQPAGGGSDEG